MEFSRIRKEALKLIEIDNKEYLNLMKISRDFMTFLKNNLKSKKIIADIFLGGSLAKKTLIKKDNNNHDIDIFVRFSNKYNEDQIPELLKKILPKEAVKVHGSRDYYQLHNGKIVLEIIPVMKIKKPDEAKNVTDLSYFHVNYILKKIIKNKKLSQEIMLAKAFLYSQECYGAESYIRGFSGYSLELLICHYKTFLNFLIKVTRSEEKIIIDARKFYKNKNEILMQVNESKLISPIILIDPTYKERNALAGLSSETFEKFKKAAIKYLKSPSLDFFIKKDISKDIENTKGILKMIAETHKQKGDIAGTKLKKFFNFLNEQIKKEFVIKKCYFFYDENINTGKFYFLLGKKRDEIIPGPMVFKKEHFQAFRKNHKNVIIKNNQAFTTIKHNKDFKQYFIEFTKKNIKIINEMSISKIKLIN